MTIAFESGYALPGGELPLNHARILHDRNRFAIRTITASAEVTDYEGDLADKGGTVDRWRPFANGLTNPLDFSESEWTASALTVGSDGRALTETNSNAAHYIEQAETFTTGENVAAAKVRLVRGGRYRFRVRAFDGTTAFNCDFNLVTGEIATGTGSIVYLDNNEYLLVSYFTASAGTGTVRFQTLDDTGAATFAGDNTQPAVQLLEVISHLSSATLRLDTFTALAGECFAVAAHNMWSSGARITFEHDSNDDNTWTSLGSVTVTNDSPIMFFFNAVTSSRWRVTVDRGALPEIGVLRVGAPLVMERPFYGGYAPAAMSRNTESNGNVSGSGQLLGRSKRRTTLSSQYQWQNLTYDWVRANLDGTDGLIQSVEDEPCFVAWRPSETQDCDYVMQPQTTPPQAQGTRDLWSFSMSGEALAYE
jgi:hypothetical protein